MSVLTFRDLLLTALHSKGACAYRELDLSPRDKAALAEQASKLKKNERLLQLRKDSMLPRITSKMAALKTEICQAFAQLGQACKQDCIGMLNPHEVA